MQLEHVLIWLSGAGVGAVAGASITLIADRWVLRPLIDGWAAFIRARRGR